MFGCLSADIYLFRKRTFFRERSWRKTLSFEEHIMSKDKYPNIYFLKMEAIVFFILRKFFCNTRSFE